MTNRLYVGNLASHAESELGSLATVCDRHRALTMCQPGAFITWSFPGRTYSSRRGDGADAVQGMTAGHQAAGVK